MLKRLELINNLDRNYIQTILTKLQSQNFDINTIVSFVKNLIIRTAKILLKSLLLYQQRSNGQSLELINNLDRKYVQTILTKLQSKNFDINTIVSYVKNLFIRTAKILLKSLLLYQQRSNGQNRGFEITVYYSGFLCQFIQGH